VRREKTTTGLPDQENQQVEVRCGEIDFVACRVPSGGRDNVVGAVHARPVRGRSIRPDPPGFRVDPHVAGPQHGCPPCTRAGRAAQHRPHPGHALPRVEGLDQIVVTAHIQAEDAVDVLVTGSDEQHGGSVARSPQPPDDDQTIPPGATDLHPEPGGSEAPSHSSAITVSSSVTTTSRPPWSHPRRVNSPST
jgi:hypothetical protein